MRDETIRNYQRLLKEITNYKNTTDTGDISIFTMLELIKKWFKCKDKGADNHIRHMERLNLIKITDKVEILYCK